MSDNLLMLLGDDSDANLQLADPSLVNFYKDLENRTYWIDSEICDCTLDLIQYILRWNREDKGKLYSERTPIRIYIDSPGGDLEIARSIIAIFNISKTPIYVYSFGVCASAASMIFLSGHKRYALPNTTFVFHKGSVTGVGGDFQQVQSFMKDYEQQIQELVNYYKEKTTYSPEVIEEKLNQGDWYVKVSEALENGVVDEIVTDIDLMF